MGESLGVGGVTGNWGTTRERGKFGTHGYRNRFGRTGSTYSGRDRTGVRQEGGSDGHGVKRIVGDGDFYGSSHPDWGVQDRGPRPGQVQGVRTRRRGQERNDPGRRERNPTPFPSRSGSRVGRGCRSDT